MATATHHIDRDATVDCGGPIETDILLSRDAEGRITLRALLGDRVQILGTFTDVANAWAAIDAIDLDG